MCLLPKQTVLWDGFIVPFTLLIHSASALRELFLPLQFNKDALNSTCKGHATASLGGRGQPSWKWQFDDMVTECIQIYTQSCCCIIKKYEYQKI